MLFLKKLAGFLYFIVMAFSGAVFLFAAVDIFPESLLTDTLGNIHSCIGARVALGVVGAVIILTGLKVLIKSRKYKGGEKLITFQNPDGEVTVSVSAIESYVRRVARDLPGIADVKASAKVWKKGISIASFVAVSAGTNIPEITENIQMTVKSKVQEMLGVEERITVTMNITKILKENEIPGREEDENVKTSSPPFREMD
jgi:uncharacterized alkaline shock family protein YloU